MTTCDRRTDGQKRYIRICIVVLCRDAIRKMIIIQLEIVSPAIWVCAVYAV